MSEPLLAQDRKPPVERRPWSSITRRCLLPESRLTTPKKTGKAEKLEAGTVGE